MGQKVFQVPSAGGATGGRVRDLLGWSPAERARLAEHVEASVRGWAVAWGLDDQGPLHGGPVVCQPRSVPDDRARQRSHAAARRRLAQAILANDGGIDGDPGALVDSLDEPGRLSTRLAARAWEDLVGRMALLGGAPAAEVGSVPFSGDLVARLGWWGQPAELVVGGDAVARLLLPARTRPSTRLPMVEMERAVRRQPVRVGAELAPFEIELGALMELAVGEVVQTRHPVAQPVVVRAGALERETTGYLGAVDGRRALALAPQVEAPTKRTRG